MDGLAQSRVGGLHEMVLPGAIRILASTDPRNQYRGEEEGPLADVHAPHHHVRPDVYKLRLSSDESGKHDLVPDGCS